MSEPFWKALLACPKCSQPMSHTDRCDHCGTDYPPENGRPRLIAADARKEVRLTYPQNQWDLDYATLYRTLKVPPRDPKRKVPFRMDPAHAQMIEERLPAGSRVLEIGCGGNQTRPWFEARGLLHVGTDLTTGRVQDWLQRHGGPEVLCDSHFLPFRDGQFDLVYSCAVIAHLACPRLAAQEAFRVLKPGGYFIGSVAFVFPWHDSSFYHLSPLGLVNHLQMAGFEVLNVWPGVGYHGFGAMAESVFRGPFRLLRVLPSVEHLGYQMQERMRRAVRQLRGLPPKPPLFSPATVSGSMDWIAQKPAAA